ncbi:MAG TPA: aminoglycoside phosphotransferase family protein [Actinomycetes bacterium]
MSEAEPDALPRWRDAGFRAEADGWVAAELARAGRRQVGAVEAERLVPWSAVWRVPTDAGPVWFKANASGVAHEARLYEVLVRRTPAHVLDPVALDPDRGWLLLPDGGPTLRQVEGSRTDLAAWERMLREYAQMQRGLETHVDELRAAGVPDAGPDRLPAMRAALLADDRVLLLDAEDGLTEAQRTELLAEQPAYEALCRDLAAYDIPLSLQHDDLHDNNVFAGPDGALRVFDWGDAVVGHPFGVLLISLRVVADLLGVPEGSAAELFRLRDAYLEPWTDGWAAADLREAAHLAVRAGGVSRADCYRRAVIDWPGPGAAPHADGVPGWLLEQRGPMPLDGPEPTG